MNILVYLSVHCYVENMLPMYLVFLLSCTFKLSHSSFAYYYTQPFLEQLPQPYRQEQPIYTFGPPPTTNSYFQRTFSHLQQLYTYDPPSYDNGAQIKTENTEETNTSNGPENNDTQENDIITEKGTDYNNYNIDVRRVIVNQQEPQMQRTSTEDRTNGFRGFAYRTQYHDGGFSNVVFLTGSNINTIQTSFPDSRTSKNLSKSTEIARTIASDSLDTNFIQENRDASSPTNNPTFTALLQILGTPQTAFQSFYSANNNLFGSDNSVPNYPANTQPLNQPDTFLQLLSRSSFATADSSTTKSDGVTTTETGTTAEEETSTVVTTTETVNTSREEPSTLEVTTKTEKGENFSASEVKINSVKPELKVTTTSTEIQRGEIKDTASTTENPASLTTEKLTTESSSSITKEVTASSTSSEAIQNITEMISTIKPLV